MDYALTDSELKLVCDAEIIAAKNRVVQTVIKMFGDLSGEYQQLLKEIGLDNDLTAGPKISKGENYLGLPYIMLDYPREFGKKDVFAIRTFFWWGNFCSTTLFLSGKYYLQYQPVLQSSISANMFYGWVVQTDPNPWMHHFEEGSHTSIFQETDLAALQTPFIKIAKKIPLKEWDEIFNKLKADFYKLLTLLKN